VKLWRQARAEIREEVGQVPRLDSEWRKASASSGNNGCVEVRLHDGKVEIRDSKNPDGGTLRISPSEWADFVGDVPARN
jgi:hypothetical protein